MGIVLEYEKAKNNVIISYALYQTTFCRYPPLSLLIFNHGSIYCHLFIYFLCRVTNTSKFGA